MEAIAIRLEARSKDAASSSWGKQHPVELGSTPSVLLYVACHAYYNSYILIKDKKKTKAYERRALASFVPTSGKVLGTLIDQAATPAKHWTVASLVRRNRCLPLCGNGFGTPMGQRTSLTSSLVTHRFNPSFGLAGYSIFGGEMKKKRNSTVPIHWMTHRVASFRVEKDQSEGSDKWPPYAVQAPMSKREKT